VQGNRQFSAAAPLRARAAGMVNQRHARQPRRKRIEVGPVLKAGLAAADQFQKQLVNQSRGFQGMPAGFTPEVRGRNLPELGIDQRSQPVQSGCVALLPLAEDGGDLGDPWATRCSPSSVNPAPSGDPGGLARSSFGFPSP
jgi:hypothetical protein